MNIIEGAIFFAPSFTAYCDYFDFTVGVVDIVGILGFLSVGILAAKILSLLYSNNLHLLVLALMPKNSG